MAEMSLRETLEAAAKGDDAPAEAVVAPVEAPAPVEVETKAEPALEAEPKPATEGRDEKGRFAPKEPKADASADAPPAQTETKTEPTTETAKPADPEPQTEAIRIPPSLPAAVKAQWSELKPEVQQAFAKLEGTVQDAKAEWSRKGERLNRYDEIMAPRAEKLALQGIDEFTAIKTLLAAQDFLERDPLGGIQHLARSYGVNLQSLSGQPNGQPPAQEGVHAPTVDPAIDAVLKPLMEQVRTLQTEFQTSKQSTEAASLAEARAAVADFASKPENMYFENVRDDVADLLSRGKATTLEQAYQKAIWASDEVRPLLMKAQASDDAKKAKEAADRRKSEQARQSAGSVTGAPSPGAVAPTGPPGSVRDSIMAAIQEHGAA